MSISPVSNQTPAPARFGNRDIADRAEPGRSTPQGRGNASPTTELHIPSAQEGRLVQKGYSPNQVFAVRLFENIQTFLDSERFSRALQEDVPAQAAEMLKNATQGLEATLNTLKTFGINPQELDQDDNNPRVR